jgi:hypothetical protein
MSPPAAKRTESADYISMVKYVDTRLEAMDKATALAYEGIQIWQIAVDKKLDELIASKNLLAGKAIQSSLTIATILSVTGLTLALIALFLK